NTLEGYFHPRQLAFGLGALAIAAALRRRFTTAACLVAGAAMLHPTTALWFAIWIGVAAAVTDRDLRRPLAIAAAAAGLAGVAAAAVAGVWALTMGPLEGRLVRMDSEWLATLATKDYLFPLEWPAFAWAFNLLYIPVVVLIYRRRMSAGLVDPAETGVAIGC